MAPLGPALPWEMGPGSSLYPGMPDAFQTRIAPVLSCEADGAPGAGVPEALEGAAAPAAAPRLRARPGPRPEVADAAERRNALAQWVLILECFRAAGSLRVSARDLPLLVKETLEPKATGTIKARAGSILLYVGWARSKGLAPGPIDEEVVYEYLRHASGVAPTRGTRFLEALGFMGFLFNINTENAFTPRARGIASGGLRRKRTTVQMAPFEVDAVIQMEKVVAAKGGGGLTQVETIFLGFVL